MKVKEEDRMLEEEGVIQGMEPMKDLIRNLINFVKSLKTLIRMKCSLEPYDKEMNEFKHSTWLLLEESAFNQWKKGSNLQTPLYQATHFN